MKTRSAKKLSNPTLKTPDRERLISCSREREIQANMIVTSTKDGPMRVSVRRTKTPAFVSRADVGPSNGDSGYNQVTVFGSKCDTVKFEAVGKGDVDYFFTVTFPETTYRDAKATVIKDSGIGTIVITVDNARSGAPIVISFDGLIGMPLPPTVVTAGSRVTVKGNANRANIVPAPGAKHDYKLHAVVYAAQNV